jgi:hypothetical protein
MRVLLGKSGDFGGPLNTENGLSVDHFGIESESNMDHF